MKPITLRPKMTDSESAIDYDDIYDQLMKLNLLLTSDGLPLESRRFEVCRPQQEY